MNKHSKSWQRTSCWFWLLAFTGVLVAGCASTKPDQTLSPPAPVEFDKGRSADLDCDRFAVGDLVSLSFSGAKGLIPSHQERVKEDGTITMPLIGAVKTAGKTPGELLKEIHDGYVPRFYRRLDITFGGQNVYHVEGQVRFPGRLMYLGPTTVTKAIQSAGGLTDLAAKHRVELIRTSGEKVEVNWINATATQGGSLDLQVFPGDRIVVPKRGSWDLFR